MNTSHSTCTYTKIIDKIGDDIQCMSVENVENAYFKDQFELSKGVPDENGSLVRKPVLMVPVVQDVLQFLEYPSGQVPQQFLEVLLDLHCQDCPLYLELQLLLQLLKKTLISILTFTAW